MKENVLAQRYAEAFIATVPTQETDKVFVFANELKEFFDRNNDIYLFLNDPMVPDAEKMSFFTEIADSSSHGNERTLNFLRLLLKENRIEILQRILEYLGDAYDNLRGIVRVTVETPYELSNAMSELIKKTITERTGKNVVLSVVVDTALLGGIRILFKNNVIDLSVRAMLTEMAK